MTAILSNGPGDAPAAILLAHGAGAPMDSPFMESVTALLADSGLRVLRFEFPYMAERRRTGRRSPPPRAEALCGFYRDVVVEAAVAGRLVIGGKSMGGRVASMVADSLYRDRVIAGLVCLGYPFHPPGRPDRPRIAHLAAMAVPTLICQGERDPFGNRSEVEAYVLPAAIHLRWIADGSHDLVPRRASGVTTEDNHRNAAAAVSDFCFGL